MKTSIHQTSKRSLRLLAGAVCALALTVSAARASVRWATLEAIHQIENPTDRTTPGSCGELGAYQFLPETWSMHSREPFRRALDRAASDGVAVTHYEWIKSGLERAGIPATPYMIGLAWNGGLDAAINGRSPRVAHAYAQRVANLSVSMDRESPPLATTTSNRESAPATATVTPAVPATVPMTFVITTSAAATAPVAVKMPAAKPTLFLIAASAPEPEPTPLIVAAPLPPSQLSFAVTVPSSVVSTPFAAVQPFMMPLR